MDLTNLTRITATTIPRIRSGKINNFDIEVFAMVQLE